MKELELNWRRAIAIWWLLTWRTWIGAIVLGGIVGGIAGGVVAVAGYSVEDNTIYFNIVGGILGLVWSLGVLRMALEKDYRGFRIALIADDDGPGNLKVSGNAETLT